MGRSHQPYKRLVGGSGLPGEALRRSSGGTIPTERAPNASPRRRSARVGNPEQRGTMQSERGPYRAAVTVDAQPGHATRVTGALTVSPTTSRRVFRSKICRSRWQRVCRRATNRSSSGRVPTCPRSRSAWSTRDDGRRRGHYRITSSGPYVRAVRSRARRPVNPHTHIAAIAVLTGITNSMVAGAPRRRGAPQFLEFAAGCVIVAHNARFDVGFLKRGCAEHRLRWPLPRSSTRGPGAAS